MYAQSYDVVSQCGERGRGTRRKQTVPFFYGYKEEKKNGRRETERQVCRKEREGEGSTTRHQANINADLIFRFLLNRQAKGGKEKRVSQG